MPRTKGHPQNGQNQVSMHKPWCTSELCFSFRISQVRTHVIVGYVFFYEFNETFNSLTVLNTKVRKHARYSNKPIYLLSKSTQLVVDVMPKHNTRVVH